MAKRKNTPKLPYGGKVERRPHRDWSEDNELPVLCEEWDTLRRRIAADKTRLDEIKAAVKDRVGEDGSATVQGWDIFWVNNPRREYRVPDMVVRYIQITRK